MVRYVWGVDSSTNVTPELLSCVENNYGRPVFWARYLTTVPNASEGLTTEEINFLRGENIKILPIYNDFREAVGYRQGAVASANATFHAARLGFPRGTYIFANVERFFNVDPAWIRGWVESMYNSGYKVGIYNDPVEGDFDEAFCQAARENNQVQIQSVLWSAEPEIGTTSPNQAPSFNPETPNCESNVWLWQYGRDSEACPIDTNLADDRILPSLW
ncbi:glycoside hydrolase domain-containing protein [Oceanobacillus salinisoli]|uniref:glycoside hydrolase domain-containing protein n=1 Tax=Oceanobacillus salinisoli TaxID=2678611 RepID=UPI0012E2EF75|nr:glycoside hydrolase domain-containing protein [Oceanobacillus salinisoli]